MKIINHWPNITCLPKAGKQYEQGGLMKLKTSGPLQRHVKKALVYFWPALYAWNDQKKHNCVSEVIRGSDPWPEVDRSSCRGLFSACVRAGLHVLEWTKCNVGLSYCLAAHTVHSFSFRLLLRLQLSPAQTSVLLQEGSEVANSPELLLFLSSCEADNSSEVYSSTTPR